MNTHELKIAPVHFAAILTGAKRFELRRNDRGFHVGNTLVLNEWHMDAYTGRKILALVTYMTGWADALQEGYVVLSIQLLPETFSDGLAEGKGKGYGGGQR